MCIKIKSLEFSSLTVFLLERKKLTFPTRSKVKVTKTTSLEDLIKMNICITFEEDTNFGFLDIEANIKMFKDRGQPDKWTPSIHYPE